MVCSENAGIVKSYSNSFYLDFLVMCGEYYETRKKLDWLIEIGDREYNFITDASSKYYMAINRDDLPHEQINRQISGYLSKFRQ